MLAPEQRCWCEDSSQVDDEKVYFIDQRVVITRPNRVGNCLGGGTGGEEGEKGG